MNQYDTAPELEPEQLRILDALLSSRSHSQAAQSLGIGRTTLYRALQDPGLSGAYRAARMEAVKHAIGRLQGLTDKAVTELENILDDGRVSAYAKVKAIELILHQAIQGSTLEELLSRIEALESSHEQTANY